MSLPRTIPLTGTVELMDAASLSLEEKTVELLPLAVAAPGASKENRSCGELPSAALWHCDVHCGFMRRSPFGIRCGGTAGTPG